MRLVYDIGFKCQTSNACLHKNQENYQNGFNQLLNLLFENKHRISWDPGSLMCNDDDYDNGNDDRVVSSINLGRTQVSISL